MIIVLIVLFIIILIILDVIYNRKTKKIENFSDYPCRAKLTDKAWVENMIKHHKMGLEISVNYLNNVKSHLLAAVIRDLIKSHEYEIYLLESHLKSNFKNISEVVYINESYRLSTVSDHFPNQKNLSSTYCDPEYFMYGHHNHMHNMTDLKYILHMIPHHLVAIDMSKILLKHTKSDFLISICNNIIRSQEAENIHLYDLSISDDIRLIS
jgi:uncharacterized protein (DUF305 family)